MTLPSTLSSGAIPLATLALLGFAGLVAVDARQEPPVAQEGPPDLRAGTKIYALDATADSRGVLTALAATAPLEVLEVRGSWAQVRLPNLPYGPVWLNFDQVVYYRTTRGDQR
jgi:hypothetical protein